MAKISSTLKPVVVVNVTQRLNIWIEKEPLEI